jgi:hypothetical protein
MAGRHALNVEIEVRVLVPKCRSKSGSAAPRHDAFDRDRLRFSAGKPTPAKPASAAKGQGRVAQLAEHLSDTEEEAGSIPAPPINTRASSSEGRALVLQTRGRWFDSSLAHSRGRSSNQVERPLETRGGAGSIPADHTLAP